MHEIVNIVRNGDRSRVAAMLDIEPTLANCTDKTRQNRSLLHLAIERNDEEMIGLLLTSGANPNKQDHSGTTPVHAAALEGYAGIVACLVSSGAKDLSDSSGYNTLNAALQSGDKDTIVFVRSWLHGNRQAEQDAAGNPLPDM